MMFISLVNMLYIVYQIWFAEYCFTYILYVICIYVKIYTYIYIYWNVIIYKLFSFMNWKSFPLRQKYSFLWRFINRRTFTIIEANRRPLTPYSLAQLASNVSLHQTRWIYSLLFIKIPLCRSVKYNLYHFLLK